LSFAARNALCLKSETFLAKIALIISPSLSSSSAIETSLTGSSPVKSEMFVSLAALNNYASSSIEICSSSLCPKGESTSLLSLLVSN